MLEPTDKFVPLIKQNIEGAFLRTRVDDLRAAPEASAAKWRSKMRPGSAIAATPAPGMVEMKLSEVFRLAGADMGDCPDAVAHVTRRPANREQAVDLLRNMTIVAPP